MVRSLVVMVFVGLAACGSDSKNNTGTGDACVEMLPGCPGSLCLGAIERGCSDDGTEYRYSLCYPGTCNNGRCQLSGCSMEPGEGKCVGPTTRRTCTPNMAGETEKECDSGTTCVAGECVAASCSVGKTECGWRSVLACVEGGTWQATACADGEYCDPDTKACAAMNPLCIADPGSAACVDSATAGTCDNLGRLATQTCSDSEVCVDGFCQPKVCGVVYGNEPDMVSVDDTTLADAGDIVQGDSFEVAPDLTPIDIPPLEKPAKAWVSIMGGLFAGEKVTFTSGKSANYVIKDSDLQIAMAKGMYMLELHFVGIEENVVGHYTSEEPGSVTVMILFNDGTHDQTVTQWKYQTKTFDVTLDAFEAVGGRVQGSFSGTLQTEDGSETLELTDGYFDVPRKL